MRTELPVDRVHRRLSMPHEDTQECEDGQDEGDDESDNSLSRWLPADSPPGPPKWVSAIRADPGRSGVIALGVVGAIAVLVTVFTLARDDPPAVASAKLPPVQMVSSASPTTGRLAPAPDGPVVVSVVGLVGQPGLVTLEPGARIADALTAAGGALDGADLIGLNIARKVSDGEQILVGIESPPGVPSVMGSSVSSQPVGDLSAPTTDESDLAPTDPVDLNTATLAQFDALPGVGPVTAAAIISWREANGRFASVEQLGEVDGIGPARLARLHDLVHV